MNRKHLLFLTFIFVLIFFDFFVLNQAEAQWLPPVDPCEIFGGNCINDCELPTCRPPDTACGGPVDYSCGDDLCHAEYDVITGLLCCENGQCTDCRPPGGGLPEGVTCGECGGCADSRYKWCTGGPYGTGTCTADFLCECRPDLCGGGGPPPSPPPSVDLIVSPAVIMELPDNDFTLNWSSSNADSCSASGSWGGGKPTSGSEAFNDIGRGTYTYAINCSGPGGSASDSVTVQILQLPQCVLSASPNSIIIPQLSVLSWTCQYADYCEIDQGIGTVNNVSGSTNVRPKRTTTYTLSCDAPDGSRSWTATINVGFQPWLKEVLPKINFNSLFFGVKNWF